jgi:apolipoprotein N-acyltransferase
MKLTKEISYVIAPILTGVLLFLSFPLFDLGFLAWLSLVPLIYFIKKESLPFSLFQGFMAGVIFYFLSLPWIAQVMNTYGNLNLVLSYLILLLLVVYLALYIGFFTIVLSFLFRKYGQKALLLAPFIWVALEYAKNYLLSGFPWILLGYSQHAYLSLIQISDIFGVYGVSFLIIAVNSLIVCWLKEGFKKKLTIIYSLATILLIVLSLFYGFKRLGESPQTGREIDVALIQGNVPQSEKLDFTFVQKIFQDHFRMTYEATKEKEMLVIWSESAVPLMFNYSPAYQAAMRGLTRGEEIYLLFGTVDKRTDNSSQKEHYFNSAFLLNPSGELTGYYDKIHLVPFSEYVPLKRLLFFINKLIPGDSDFTPGKNYTLLRYKDIPFCVPICYEVIFPEINRRFVRRGAEFIVTITNDAWFGRSSAPYQHFNMAIFRAIENRRWLARAANTGISGVVDPYGRVVEESEIFIQKVINSKIYSNSKITIYTRWGDVLPWITIIITCTFLGISIIKKNDGKEK